MTNQLSRRNFLKGVGVVMGGVASASALDMAPSPHSSPRVDANGLTIHKRAYKYPWWVKTVDQMTTELDPSIDNGPPPMHFSIYSKSEMFAEQRQANNEQAKAYVREGIVNDIPGRTLPDVALHYAAHTYMLMGSDGSFDAPPTPRISPAAYAEVQSYNLHPPQDFGLPAWEATPEEASKVVEQAGIQLGASMVGFTRVNPKWLYKHVVVDSEATHSYFDPETRRYVVPESYQNVIIFISQGPRDLLVRNQSELGAAGDRAAYSRVFAAANNIIRFIKGLGYGTAQMNPLAPVIPYAIQAGLGELGRMNRMINPLFGGNVRIEGILTDLPLAETKPIDFGLQEFCKKCKKCATSCPSGALSTADEPYWETANQFQAPGKKAYFEDNAACSSYMMSRGMYCSTCMAVCPWSKQDKTALHDIAKIMSSQLPQAGSILTKLDDAFGYDIVELDSDEMADWWSLDIPEFGVDSYQGKG